MSGDRIKLRLVRESTPFSIVRRFLSVAVVSNDPGAECLNDMRMARERGFRMKIPCSAPVRYFRETCQVSGPATFATASGESPRVPKYRARAIVFALLSILCCPRSEAMDTPDAEDWEEICNLGAPTPTLAAAAYSDYKMKSEPDHVLDESASIDAGHRVAIHGSSCVDSVSTTIRIDVRNVSGGEHDIDYWAGYARAKILALKTSDSQTETLPALMEFLSRLPGHPANSHSVSICMDGTRPDRGDCAWRTGGSHKVTFRREGEWMTITVMEDSSH
jgi:hypothetical protein